jgi:hypothetical protein
MRRTRGVAAVAVGLAAVLVVGCATPQTASQEPAASSFSPIEVSFATPEGSVLTYLEQQHSFPSLVRLDPNRGKMAITMDVRFEPMISRSSLPGDVKVRGDLLLLKGTIEVNRVALSDTDRLARYRFSLSKEELEKLINGEVLRKWHFSAEGKKLYLIELGLE